MAYDYGEVAEWSNAAVLKTVASQGAVSSNLTLSASFLESNRISVV